MENAAFGRYRLLERIGVGGMAEVFRAKTRSSEGLERLVAIKRMNEHLSDEQQFTEMFIDEANIAANLNHANIAQIFDLGQVEGRYYIALEHVHGRDMRSIFHRYQEIGRAAPVPHICYIMAKVCDGLDYAHSYRDPSGQSLDLVHRDVSPQNVLVSFDGEVKIIDFGIAKAVNRSSNKTQAGIIKGKFAYMSPEQLRGLPVDRRSDVFACGIVLWEMLTGQRLFYSRIPFKTIRKVRNAEVPPPREANPDLPEPLERIVLRALSRHPEDRYQTASELGEALDAFARSRGQMSTRTAVADWLTKLYADEYAIESARIAELWTQSRDSMPARDASRDSGRKPAVSGEAFDNRETLRPFGRDAVRRIMSAHDEFDGAETLRPFGDSDSIDEHVTLNALDDEAPTPVVGDLHMPDTLDAFDQDGNPQPETRLGWHPALNELESSPHEEEGVTRIFRPGDGFRDERSGARRRPGPDRDSRDYGDHDHGYGEPGYDDHGGYDHGPHEHDAIADTWGPPVPGERRGRPSARTEPAQPEPPREQFPRTVALDLRAQAAEVPRTVALDLRAQAAEIPRTVALDIGKLGPGGRPAAQPPGGQQPGGLSPGSTVPIPPQPRPGAPSGPAPVPGQSQSVSSPMPAPAPISRPSAPVAPPSAPAPAPHAPAPAPHAPPSAPVQPPGRPEPSAGGADTSRSAPSQSHPSQAAPQPGGPAPGGRLAHVPVRIDERSRRRSSGNSGVPIWLVLLAALVVGAAMAGVAYIVLT